MKSDLHYNNISEIEMEEELYGIDKEEISGEESYSEPYDPSKIRIDPLVMPVFQVVRKIQFGEIELFPTFQRRIVWDRAKQSRLIESLLLRIPLPSFYLDIRQDDTWLVVDGLQRLWTFYSFCATEHTRYKAEELGVEGIERLVGLEFYGNQLHGKTFAELPRNYQRRIEETQLNLHVIKPDTHPDLRYHIFFRINTSGTVLSPQEIRNALYQGNATIFLKKMAQSREFFQATDRSINQRRMDDQECILRYCAFHLTPYTEYRDSKFDDFLNNTLQRINAMNEIEIATLEEQFLRAMRLSCLIFGNDAFRKEAKPATRRDSSGQLRYYPDKRRRSPINKALFEVWSVCLQKYDETYLIDHKKNIVKGLNSVLKESQNYFNAITNSTGSVENVRQRFEITRAIIEGRYDVYLRKD